MNTSSIILATILRRMPIIVVALVVLVAIVPAKGLCLPGGMSDKVVDYPALTGPYMVGKATYDWTDVSRYEPATGNTTYRELMVYIWYPAVPAKGAKEGRLMDKEMSRTYMYEDGYITDDHTYADAPVAAAGLYPVILASPADGDTPVFMTSIATQLASHGYVVVGVSDPHNAMLTRFDQGKAVGIDPTYTTNFIDLTNLTNDEYLSESMSMAVTIENRRVADTSFVLDRLEKLNGSDPVFKGRLDMSRVGIFGHSIGGTAAVASAENDPRIKAVVNLDGPLSHDVSATGLSQPVLTMSQYLMVPPPEMLAAMNRTEAEFIEMFYMFQEQKHIVFVNSSTAYEMTIIGAAHYNFADPGMLGLQNYYIGPIDGAYAMRINNAYIQAFFDQYLEGVDSPLLHGENAYPEVIFQGHVDGQPI